MDTPASPLEQALRLAATDPAARPDFYRLLLEAEIFVIGESELLPEGAWTAKEGESIAGDWGIVGCLATAEPDEIPMAPITMMRNALGVEEGGSDVPLDRAAYQRSVAYWERHANWRVVAPVAGV